MKIAYQGVSGAYSEIAAEKYAKTSHYKKCDPIGCRTFEEVFEGVDSGKYGFGLVPAENSLAGSIYRTFDLLSRFDVKIIGEIYVQVNHNIVVFPGTKKEDIEEIYSHWQALNQCEHNIKSIFPNAKVVEFYDTAGAAEMVYNKKDKKKAAICSERAGKIYKLKSLIKNFQDDKDNYTRFLVIGKKYAKFESSGTKSTQWNKYKTSLIFAGKDVTGFLFKALACFSLRNINLTKIESRPVPKSPWQNYFYLDFEGKYDDENIKNAIENLQQIATEVKILGSYEATKI